MNISLRWPLHPAPVEGEALSPWLCRVAACYEMDLMDLLLYEWGKRQIIDLDIRPPDGFLETIASRSGIDLNTLRCMTIVGWVPWLIDSFDLDGDSFNCYVNQFSVLLPKKFRLMRTAPGWRAWLPQTIYQRVCPVCLSKSIEKPIYKLAWQLPLFVSCPVHGCWLELVRGYSDNFHSSVDRGSLPRAADQVITKMDRYTEQAFTTGYVNLPRRNIHAGLWYRLLRTLIEDISTPVTRCGAQSKTLKKIWSSLGYSLRAGKLYWQPFEILEPAVQVQFLEAAATTLSYDRNPRNKSLGDIRLFIVT
ncbi:TniQ family protein [Methyloglobulus sp.]|uniref:TniQ family protein n=1 Tax=Methyloglobulus sp. TaxID=2518622 RepID=UPI0032B72837